MIIKEKWPLLLRRSQVHASLPVQQLILHRYGLKSSDDCVTHLTEFYFLFFERSEEELFCLWSCISLYMHPFFLHTYIQTFIYIYTSIHPSIYINTYIYTHACMHACKPMSLAHISPPRLKMESSWRRRPMNTKGASPFGQASIARM